MCGASVSAASPDDLAHRSLPPSDDDEMQFELNDTGSRRTSDVTASHSRRRVPEHARTSSSQGLPSPPPELPPKKSRKLLPPPPPPLPAHSRPRPALPAPAPSHAQFYHRHLAGGFNGHSSDDAIKTPMHAWTNGSSSSSNNSSNGFIGTNINNKRQNNSSSCSSSTSSSTVVRDDRSKQQFTLPETFVDEGVSFVRFATSKNNSLYPQQHSNVNNNNLNRSASSVTTRTKAKAPIAKPVRRSKSQLVQQRNYVTNIQHGGAVTLVSLNSDSSSSSGHSDRFSTQLVHHHHHHFVEEDLDNEWHRGKTEVSAFQVSSCFTCH